MLEAEGLNLWRQRAKTGRLGHLELPSDSIRDASASQAEGREFKSAAGDLSGQLRDVHTVAPTAEHEVEGRYDKQVQHG